MGQPSYCGPDCNANSVPDDCDLNCGPTGGSCDLPGCGLSLDTDGDGVPDECIPPCFTSSAPSSALPDGGFGTANRYLAILAGDPGRLQAIRVIFTDLLPPYDLWNGTIMWVQSPQTICENSSQIFPPCAGTTFQGAALGCTPYYTDWDAHGVVYAYTEGIIPSSLYTVQVIDEVCQVGDEANYSVPASLETSGYGDICDALAGGNWPPPNGSVSIVSDTIAVLAKFSNNPNAPIKARADLEPANVDFRINITDVLETVFGFQGRLYPQTPSVADPCPGSLSTYLNLKE